MFDDYEKTNERHPDVKKIKELKTQIKNLKRENIALKNRCHSLNDGTLCSYCTFDCRFNSSKGD